VNGQLPERAISSTPPSYTSAYAMIFQSKPPVTGSSHPLPFEKLSPLDFERLCLWLVKREGFTRAEHLGEAGSEGGRDVVAWKDGRRFVFQCKRPVEWLLGATTACGAHGRLECWLGKAYD
jgi:hypothetical protein